MLALHCFAQGTPASLSAGKSPHDHRKGFLTHKSKTKYCMSGFGPYLNMAGHTKTLTTPPAPSTTHQQDTTTHRSATQPSSQPSHHSSNRKNRGGAVEATGGEAEALLKAAWISSTSSARIEELKTKTLKFLTSHPFIKMQRSATHLLQGVLRRQMAQRISAVREGIEVLF